MISDALLFEADTGAEVIDGLKVALAAILPADSVIPELPEIIGVNATIKLLTSIGGESHYIPSLGELLICVNSTILASRIHKGIEPPLFESLSEKHDADPELVRRTVEALEQRKEGRRLFDEKLSKFVGENGLMP